MRGRPEIYLDDSTFDIDDREFISGLFTNIFYRNPKPDVINKYLLKLYKTKLETLPKKMKPFRKNKNVNSLNLKKAIYNSFINSEEYNLKKNFSIIDLSKDPFEENEINPSFQPKYFVDYLSHLEDLFQIQGSTRI